MPRETSTGADALDLAFSGELWYWRGPAPFHFVTVPDDGSAALHAISADVSYGWGMIPVTARIGTRPSAWNRQGKVERETGSEPATFSLGCPELGSVVAQARRRERIGRSHGVVARRSGGT